MKQQISKDDYEIYSIAVSPGILFKRNLKDYLFKELEKRHPCFGNDHCYESRLCIRGKGIFADVAVMEKLRLGEYRVRYPGKKLTAEGFFEDKRSERILYLLGTGILFLSLLSGKFISVQRDKKNTGPLKEERNAESYLQEEPLFVKAHKAIPVTARTERIEWSCIGGSEILALSVKNCYPGILMNEGLEGTYSDVSLIDSIPVFSCVFRTHWNGNENTVENLSEGIMEKIREAITSTGGMIEKESLSPSGISFRFGIDNLNKVLTNIEKCMEENQKSVVSFKIFKEKKTSCLCEISFSNSRNGKTLSGESDLSLFSCAKAWMKSENEIKETETKTSRPKERKDSINLKLGAITHSDGKNVVFYKDKEGKIKNAE